MQQLLLLLTSLHKEASLMLHLHDAAAGATCPAAEALHVPRCMLQACDEGIAAKALQAKDLLADTKAVVAADAITIGCSPVAFALAISIMETALNACKADCEAHELTAVSSASNSRC
jgi:hypothetical protein